MATCGDEPEDERRATETLLDRGVDSLILATARLDDSLPASLLERGIPHVLAIRTVGFSPSSLGDDEAGGYLATRHLIDLGTGTSLSSPGRGSPRARATGSQEPSAH